MSWLSKALSGIHFDSHTLGNLAKNVSPLLAFTPLGLPGTAALAALGEAGRGHANLGDMARAGLSNAAIGGGVRGGVGLLRNAIGGDAAGAAGGSVGSSAEAAGTPSVAPSVSNPLADIESHGIPGVQVTPSASAFAGGVNSQVAGAATGGASGGLADGSFSGLGAASGTGAGTNAAGSDPSGFLRRAVGGVGSFIEKNPTATAMGLQGLGSLATSGARNRLANTEADAADYDLQSKKRRDSYLAQYLAQYGAPRAVAPNPYAQGSPAYRGG